MRALRYALFAALSLSMPLVLGGCVHVHYHTHFHHDAGSCGHGGKGKAGDAHGGCAHRGGKGGCPHHGGHGGGCKGHGAGCGGKRHGGGGKHGAGEGGGHGGMHGKGPHGGAATPPAGMSLPEGHPPVAPSCAPAEAASEA